MMESLSASCMKLLAPGPAFREFLRQIMPFSCHLWCSNTHVSGGCGLQVRVVMMYAGAMVPVCHELLKKYAESGLGLESADLLLRTGSDQGGAGRRAARGAGPPRCSGLG